MEQRAKWDWGPAALVGIIFPTIGLIYLIIGMILYFHPSDAEAYQVAVAFIPLGAVFLLVGILLLCLCLIRKRRADRLLMDGRFIWGEVAEFVRVKQVNIGTRNPQIAMVHYRDAAGTLHIFRSRCLYRYADPSAIGKKVRIYVADDSYQPYYVDIDPVLPTNVKEH